MTPFPNLIHYDMKDVGVYFKIRPVCAKIMDSVKIQFSVICICAE